MKKIVALIYKSYLYRSLPIPHFRAMATIAAPIFLLLAAYSTYFGLDVRNNRGQGIVIASILFGILVLIFSFIFKKEELDKYEFTEGQLKRVLPYYWVGAFILIIVLFSSLFIINLIR